MSIPPFLKPRILVAATAALALSACFSTPDVMKRSDAKRPAATGDYQAWTPE